MLGHATLESWLISLVAAGIVDTGLTLYGRVLVGSRGIDAVCVEESLLLSVIADSREEEDWSDGPGALSLRR